MPASMIVFSSVIKHRLELKLLPEKWAVARLPARAALPAWATTDYFFSITRTPDELSIVLPDHHIPDGALAERDWRALQVAGSLDFDLVGVLAALAGPLADAGVSIFVISTYDTDYLLVKVSQLPRALTALHAAGHIILTE